MTHPVTKRLRLAGITAAAAGVVVIACLLVPQAVPSQWLASNSRTSLGGNEAFIVRDGEPPHTLRYWFQFEPLGRYVQYAVRITIEIDERPPWTSAESTLNRDAAMERIRTAFVKDCNDSALPELAGLFDAAWDSPGHTTVYEYPRRRPANRLLWCTAVAAWAAAVVLAAAFAAVLWLVPQWIAVLRRERYGLCVHCGYDLTGTGGGRCPECGK